MKKMALSLGFLICLIVQVAAQEKFDTKYNLIISTVTRDAEATLFVNKGDGNTFAGVLTIDGDKRPVFGWYTKHISEGGLYIYNTEGIVFYVDLKKDFQRQQLFKGLFNYDKTKFSGTYFFWGNEFNFTGEKILTDSQIDK